MPAKLRTFCADDSGATAIEYGLIAALVAVGIVSALTVFGGGLAGLFNAVSSKSATAMGG